MANVELEISDKFIAEQNQIAVPPCNNCKNYDRENNKEITCRAFTPDRIPEVILQGKNDHKKPFPGDNGIRFDPIEK